MNTTAIQQAIRLYKHPKEMQWLGFPETLLPDGVTDLLRLYASKQKLTKFAEKLHLNKNILNNVLSNFIEVVILKEKNSYEKQLGLLESDTSETYKLHYKLLMKIYHPDRNTSPNAAAISSNITKAYQHLKNKRTDNLGTLKSQKKASSRTPPNSFYRATLQAEQQISRTRNAFVAISALSFVAIITLALNLYQPDKPQLVINSADKQFLTVSTKENTKPSNTLNGVNDVANNAITLAKLDVAIPNNIPESQLQQLLHKLETAYEKGDVKQIKPILENAPEIRNQTDAEIKAKLETLFKITSDRKMLLFNVDWRYISNHQLRGQGKFLSRYLLMGEEQWLTREGNAILTADISENRQLKITSLKLENKTIEQ